MEGSVSGLIRRATCMFSIIMNTLINSIYEANDESKVELVVLMREEIAAKQQVIIGDLRRVFVLVNGLLQANSALILETHQLLITVSFEA